MKTLCTTIFACILALSLFSQNEKGLTPSSKKNTSSSGTTYAVVIGISDYQDAGIPDLNFADRDAEAFAEWLKSPAGGSLDIDHLRVLINKEATAGKVAAALDWLLEQAKEGDQTIIYFSGHGDVERKTISQPGFLLCWDSPAKVYMGGGTFGLAYFQEIITTLSVQQKAKVLVVTDVCHAGKLAGSQIGGAQITGASLARQYASEIKILSCQPDEFSVEGVQWGGGRGVFSYHLVEGLFGFADQNADRAVTVGELDRYLEEYVTAEAAPQSQVPILLGNKTERLALVNDALLAELKQKKETGLATFGASNNKGLEDDVLSKLDSGIVRKYFAFKRALQENRFFEPVDNCAESLYAELTKVQGLAPLHSSMKRNYAAALQDGAQQELNTMLKTGLTEEVLSGKRSANIYKDYTIWLGRAASLLGETHYIYPALMARKYFFEGKLQKRPQDKREFMHKALQWQADMPHAYVELIHTCSKTEVDSAEYFAQKAMELVPNWVVPRIWLAIYYERALGYQDKAERLLDEAEKLDSSSALVRFSKGNLYAGRHDNQKALIWYQKTMHATSENICFNRALQYLGDTYLKLGQYKEAEDVLIRAVQMDSAYGGTLNRLGKVYWITGKYEESELSFKKEIRLSPNEADRVMAYNELGNLYTQMNRLMDAEVYYLKAIEADSTNINPHFNLALIYMQTNRFEEALAYCQKSIEVEPRMGDSYVLMGTILAKMNRPVEAEQYALKGIQIDPSTITYYTYACLLSIIHKPDEAMVPLEEAFKLGFNDYDWLVKDADLTSLHDHPKWKELTKKYFPDKVKD